MKKWIIRIGATIFIVGLTFVVATVGFTLYIVANSGH